MSVKKSKRGYQVDWRDAAGKRRRETFTAKKDAETFERRMLQERDAGVLPHLGGDTLAEFLDEWERTHLPSLRQNTIVGYQGSIRKHIRPMLGDAKLKNLDQRTIQDWVNELTEKGLSPRTVEYNFTVLGTILRLANEYGLCKPIHRHGRGQSGVRLPKKVTHQVNPPTLEQILRVSDLIDARYRALVLVAGLSGLRQSECFGLHPDAVDFAGHRIHVRRTVEHSTGAIVDMTKNGRPRVVTMTSLVADALRSHIVEYPNPDFVFHAGDKRLDSSHFNRDVWKPAKTAAGLPDLHFHHLRHAAASIMAKGGWTANKVQQELGHATPGFTLQQYTHLWPEDSDSQRLGLDEALQAALGAARSAPGETRTPTPKRATDFEPAASTDSATGADEEDTP